MILRSSPWSTVALLVAYLLTGGSSSPAPATVPPASVAVTVPAARPPAPAGRPAAPAGRTRPLVLGYYAQFSPEDRAAQDSLVRNRRRLTSVAPLWYSLSAGGALVRRGYDRGPLLAAAGPVGLPVLALITNAGMNSAIVTDPQARARGVEAVYRLVRDNRLAGVNIDFEGLPPAAGRGLVAFLRQLYERMKPGGYTVTIAVPARRSDDAADNDWAAAYDYGALARWADYLVLMTYDQHWQTGSPGPIAALWWVEEVLRYALGRVPAPKILLGLAGYGYDWADDGSAVVVPAAEAENLAARYGTALRWDDEGAEPTFTYWKNGVRHTVWLENSYSVELRLQLVDKYHLAGAALWRLGQEESRLWKVIDRWAS